MLVCEHFLISSTEITIIKSLMRVKKYFPRDEYTPHHFAMLALDMAMKVGPSQASYIALIIRAIVS